MNITFGQYYPVSSVIHKLDPRIKILLTTMLIVTVFLAKTFAAYGVIVAFILISILLSRVPVLTVLKSVRMILFLLIFTLALNIFFNKEGEVLWEWKFICITKGGLIFAAKMAIRLISLVVGASLLTLTTTPTELTDGIESLLRPLKVIKIPVHDIAITMSIALRFIPTLMEETDKIMKAQKSRGACFDEGGLLKRAKALLPILIPLIVSSLRRADELALALDSRCYNAVTNRTRYKEMHVKLRDIIALLLMAGLIVASVLL